MRAVPDPRVKPPPPRLIKSLSAWVVALSSCLSSGCASECPAPISTGYDDPGSEQQWYLQALGVLDAPPPVPGSTVLVAVIDNGVDRTHPDLVDRIDASSYDLLDLDDDVMVSEADVRSRDHGTEASGIIAAQRDNGVGIAGLCPECRLLVLVARDFVDRQTVLPLLDLAVDRAITAGARVLSISDGVLRSELDPELLDRVQGAMERASEAGIVVVASAGNDAADDVRLPGRIPSVIAVAATDCEGAPADFSSFGIEIALSAPGECVFTTQADGGYGNFRGTSASAPIVAALAGRLLAQHPDWSPAEVEERMRATARPVELGGHPKLEGRFGSGTIDFAAALAP